MSAVLSALAEVLKGGSQVGREWADSSNRATAAKNRDAVLRWADEQSKIKDIEKQFAAVKVPLPNTPAERGAVLAQFGIDPEADKPVEEYLQTKSKAVAPTGPDLDWEAAVANGATPEQADQMRATVQKRRDEAGLAGGVRTKAEAGQALGGSGSTKVEERRTDRRWSSQTADRVRDAAVNHMNSTLQRPERGTEDIDQTEAQLRKKYDLASGYSSYLDKEDLPSLLKQIEGLSSSRNARVSSDNSLRGDQTQIATGILNADRMMEQAGESAAAKAEEGDKNRGVKVSEGDANRRSRERIAGARINLARDKAFNDFVKFDAGNSLKALQAAQRNAGMIASALKGAKRPEQQATILKGFGIEAELQKPFFGRAKVEWDETSVQAAIDEARVNYEDAAKRLRKQSRRQVGDREPSGGAPPKGTSEKPLPSGWVRGADGVMRKQPAK